MSKAKFYLCEHCKNLVGMIHDAGVPIVCCGQKMTALEPNTTEAAGEKHLPVIEQCGSTVTVNVGEVAHPMSEEHSIEWIYLETSLGGQRKSLAAGKEPKAQFVLADGEKALAAYAYCNLHGLWKTEI